MTYKPISDYGVIGDMHSAALVSKGGSIDWLCFPRFDSPSVFAAILDYERGGRFAIQPPGDYRFSQTYLDDTNILVTSFQTDEGRASVTDFMPVAEDITVSEHEVIRVVRCESGRVALECLFQPRLDYGRAATRLTAAAQGVLARNGSGSLSLASAVSFRVEDGTARAAFSLRAGESAAFVLRWDEDNPRPLADYDIHGKLGSTEAYWRTVAGDWRYQGRWADAVKRSGLALHQLLYAPTGAICAAITTSLPEKLSSDRNWDYRYCWLRDAALTLDVFHRLGYTADTSPFMSWLGSSFLDSPDGVQTLYGIGRETEIQEYVLDHLEGYRGSRPVRVGNAAAKQFQLDIYGEVLLSFASYYRAGGHIDDALWRLTETLVEAAVNNWRLPDHGIWEVRAEPRHFVYSKLMCWVAVDRGIRLAKALGRPADVQRWQQARRAIREDILANAWSERAGAFGQSYGSDVLDASLLFMPIVGFLSAKDPRMESTIMRIQQELSVNGLVRRYLPWQVDDGLGSDEGTFTMCTLWLVGCLIQLGRLEEAQRLFERVISLSNHVDLFSEMVDAESGEFLGNYPQAFTHIALIHTTRNLDRALRQAELGRVSAR
ncbi:MAG: glycoside hydrolase family 15 protein [Chloroflexota bacterium]|nr:glycoside hydrolase family 15 protein [Chloroflexota bacterium]